MINQYKQEFEQESQKEKDLAVRYNAATTSETTTEASFTGAEQEIESAKPSSAWYTPSATIISTREGIEFMDGPSMVFTEEWTLFDKPYRALTVEMAKEVQQLAENKAIPQEYLPLFWEYNFTEAGELKTNLPVTQTWCYYPTNTSSGSR
ncbi:hypothetical protein FQN57_004347 [Myotisia sp. PD_48]|nr:hypothetical protein FQN57_004347 [Myotisia sp. PD_48]